MSEAQGPRLLVSMPDSSIAIPRDGRPDQYPIRDPAPQRPTGDRPSLAVRRRRRLLNS